MVCKIDWAVKINNYLLDVVFDILKKKKIAAK